MGRDRYRWDIYGDLPDEVLTLDFLQTMNLEVAKKYFSENRKRFPLNFKKLVYAIVMASKKLNWQPKPGDERGVMEFWYNPVKAITLRFFPSDVNQNDLKSYVRGYLSSMVRQNYTEYRQLGILDFRTMREEAKDIDRANCWNDVVLFVEKDSAYHYVQPLKNLLNISIISGFGFSNTAGIEDMSNVLPEGKEYDIYTLTDYDPYGEKISEDHINKLIDLGLKIRTRKRIAINPDQVPYKIQEHQKYPVKMTLKAAVEWCNEKGLEGPHYEAYKPVKENGKTVGKKLLYSGTKCYGLEIEAITGEPGGAPLLRELVLKALLKELKEHERFKEITAPLWDEVDWNTLRYHLDEDTYDYWQKYKVAGIALDYYLTPEKYESEMEEKETERDVILGPLQEHLSDGEDTLEKLLEEMEDSVSESYAKANEKIEELHDKHIKPLEEELEKLRAEHITPIEEGKEILADLIRDEWRTNFINEVERNVEELESAIAEAESPFALYLSQLDETYEKSRCLYAHSIYCWITDNVDWYQEISADFDDLNFGLPKGFLLTALKESKTARDVIQKADDFSKTKIYENISDDIENDSDTIEEIEQILTRLVRNAVAEKNRMDGY